MALNIVDLEIGYRQRSRAISIASNLNLSFSEGELICLMGPNGVGKSTLLRTITGLQQPLAGSIEIAGQDLFSLSSKERARLLAVVLTESSSNGLMTVKEAVALGRYPHTNWRDEKSTTDLEHITSAIHIVGLEERAEQPLLELSDGYLQKVSIARALCQDTPLIILDEPTVHLDVRNKREVMELLRRLCTEKNKSVLISTHDLNLAKTFADRIWLFDDGEISTGIPEDLILQGKIQKVFGESDDYQIRKTKQLEVTLHGDGQLVSLVEDALKKAGIENKVDSAIQIQCTGHNAGHTFDIDQASFKASTIESLINHLLEMDQVGL